MRDKLKSSVQDRLLLTAYDLLLLLLLLSGQLHEQLLERSSHGIDADDFSAARPHAVNRIALIGRGYDEATQTVCRRDKRYRVVAYECFRDSPCHDLRLGARLQELCRASQTQQAPAVQNRDAIADQFKFSKQVRAQEDCLSLLARC